LAGPVVAAAVILDPQKTIIGLADSKKLSASQREALAALIKSSALAWSVGIASVEEIDTLNILQATMLAMQRAVAGLSTPPGHVLVDGNRTPVLAIPATAIVKGDSTVPVISAASIVAKVTRDDLMLAYAQSYPQFSFQQHKGYGTRLHITELEQYGILPIHRKSFNPVKSWLEQRASS
jgi:ribonuclease HII